MQEEKKCAVCEKNEKDVHLFQIAKDTYICAECLTTFLKTSSVLANTGSVSIKDKSNVDAHFNKKKQEKNLKQNNLFLDYTPELIKNELDKYVIGQEDAKIKISVAVYNHYKRINMPPEQRKLVEKSNIIIIGPTGSGKTLLARTIANIINVPFAEGDASSFTEYGFIGEDPNSVIRKLLLSSEGISAAEQGIIYLDEIDKIRKRPAETSGTATNLGVQWNLLRMVEGDNISIQNRPTMGIEESLNINTKDILFIAGGAFSGIENLIPKNKNTVRKTVGFVQDNASPKKENILYNGIAPETLVRYGFEPEFIGRFPIIIRLNKLSAEDLIRVLTEPKNAIVKQYQMLFEADNVKLLFTKDALRYIAEEAYNLNTGARGLKAIVETYMNKLMFYIPSMKIDECIIDKNFLLTGQPILKRNGKKVYKKIIIKESL